METSEDERGSDLTASLERVWHMLRTCHSEIPPAVITLYASPTRRPRQNNGVLGGHFSPAAWLPLGVGKGHEIGINPCFFGEAQEVLNILLHEAAHAVLHGDSNNGIKHLAGCAIHDHHYHRTEFRDLCKKWGLECKFRNKRYGFCDSGWPEAGPARQYTAVLRYIEKHIPAAVHPLPQRPKTRQAHFLSLRCHCESASRIVYVRREMARAGGIRCEQCGALFELPKELRHLLRPLS